MQPINYKLLVVKYIINVVLFAVLYVLIAYLLLYFNISGFPAGVIPIIVAGFGMINLMKIIGPWIDSHLVKK